MRGLNVLRTARQLAAPTAKRSFFNPASIYGAAEGFPDPQSNPVTRGSLVPIVVEQTVSVGGD